MPPAVGVLFAGACANTIIWSGPRSTATTLTPLPHVPAERAAKILAAPTPAFHSVSFLIRTPPPLQAFYTPVAARTTASLPP